MLSTDLSHWTKHFACNNCCLHLRKNPKCLSCLVAYATRAKHIARKEERPEMPFGQIVTCDHVHCLDYWKRPGVGGFEHLLNCYCLGSDFLGAMTCKHQNTFETEEGMRMFCGVTFDIQPMHCGRHKAVDRVCMMHGIPMRRAPPGDSQSNGVIESLNRRVQAGARAHLHCAGLPCCFWPYASQHWCALRNFAPRDGKPSPYALRYTEEFTGLLLPIGCGVCYCPTKTRYSHVNKMEPRLCYGVFMGYDLDYGYRWNGLYMVADIDDFINLSLDMHADPKPSTNSQCHTTPKWYVLTPTVSVSPCSPDTKNTTRQFLAAKCSTQTRYHPPTSYMHSRGT